MRAILLLALCAVTFAADDTPAKVMPANTDFQNCKIVTAVFRIEVENTGTPDAPAWAAKAHARRCVVDEKGNVVATLPDVVSVDVSADLDKTTCSCLAAVATKALAK